MNYTDFKHYSNCWSGECNSPKGKDPSMLKAFTWPKPTVSAVLAVQVKMVWGSTARFSSWWSKLGSPCTRSVCSELRLAGPRAWTECASVCWYLPLLCILHLRPAVCTVSSGGFPLQQSSFPPCELVLATAGWTQKEDVFRESRPAERADRNSLVCTSNRTVSHINPCCSCASAGLCDRTGARIAHASSQGARQLVRVRNVF